MLKVGRETSVESALHGSVAAGAADAVGEGALLGLCCADAREGRIAKPAATIAVIPRRMMSIFAAESDLPVSNRYSRPAERIVRLRFALATPPEYNLELTRFGGILLHAVKMSA